MCIRDRFNDADKNDLDGIKFTWDDKWVHLRRSNTEPIIRIISEAADHKIARSLIDSLRDNISS